ncbi:hypothetical protein P781_04905 [Vibrio mimicus CAIM 1883]|nr:hypothetical protein P781_04905 [Vibrio mimicus CAIM 1883]ERM62074.1 hypothetical protein P780_04890 [Vibrio mimicus CAIM 1882]
MIFLIIKMWVLKFQRTNVGLSMVLIAQVYADIEQSKLRIKRKGLINQPLSNRIF